MKFKNGGVERGRFQICIISSPRDWGKERACGGVREGDGVPEGPRLGRRGRGGGPDPGAHGEVGGGRGKGGLAPLN